MLAIPNSRSESVRQRGFRYWRNLFVFTLACCTIGFCFLQYVAYPIILANGLAHPKRMAVCCQTPADFGAVYDDVSITTDDRLTLRGWYIPSRNRAAIILLHPIAANRVGTLRGAQMLSRHGYGLLLLDLRAHGESDGERLTLGGPEAQDLRAVVAYLQRRPDIDPERVGIMGWSLGAQVGILAAALEPGIKAVVADGPGAAAFEDWPVPKTLEERLYVPFDLVFYQAMPFFTGVTHPLSIRQAIGQLSPRPVLLISADSYFERARMEYFMDAAKEPNSLWVVQQAGHIEGISKRPAEYEEKVVDFFNKALLGNAP